MKPLAIVLGAAGLLAAGAAAAFFLTASPHRTAAPSRTLEIAAPPQAATSAPPQTAPTTAPDAAPQADWALPPAIAFVPLKQNFSLIRDSAAYVAASQNAPQFYPLKAGTPLISAARSPDGAWTVAMTADGRAAFLPSADLGPYDPSRAPNAAASDIVSGAARVIDTATLLVDGQTVPLDGLAGSGAPYAAQLQSVIDRRGSRLSCTVQKSGRYLCTLPDGQDIGRSALFNGVAGISEDASEDYRTQADSARTAHRGMWK